MRRKRCPYCKSLNTAEAIAANKETITMTFRECDDCGMSFDIRERQSDGTWIKIPDKAEQ